MLLFLPLPSQLLCWLLADIRSKWRYSGDGLACSVLGLFRTMVKDGCFHNTRLFIIEHYRFTEEFPKRRASQPKRCESATHSSEEHHNCPPPERCITEQHPRHSMMANEVIKAGWRQKLWVQRLLVSADARARPERRMEKLVPSALLTSSTPPITAKDGNGSGSVRVEYLGTQNRNPNLKPEPDPNSNSGTNSNPKPKPADTRNRTDNPKPEFFSNQQCKPATPFPSFQ